MGVALPTRASVVCGSCLVAALCLSHGARAQTQTAPANPPKPCTATCNIPTPDTPSASPTQQFPYPNETKKPAAPSPDPEAPSVTPNAPAPSAPGSPPAKQFPYPGESSSTPDSSGSSSSSPSDPSAPAVNPDSPAESGDDTSTDKFPRRRLPKVKNLQTDEERETEDLTVARFYIDKGNWNAAYLRSKDAVKHGPDDPDAHQLLAETAQKLNKRDEAISEYNAILKLDASEKQVKAARKALAGLK